ncbi:hypothetical protein P171DRAFT_446470 [Karstenula rhodostoma CBS 690.94]|uniref:Uncharacterized protein n=1 Tax=Karstenula rhodostoma CBS 690.94 TaxID=1392251 RepID=A0A9P4PCK7_9PLEO|nr:hypothetical protein P171DRAFT_446470 [Karstenula rhodostoma CBS 690.94]
MSGGLYFVTSAMLAAAQEAQAAQSHAILQPQKLVVVVAEWPGEGGAGVVQDIGTRRRQLMSCAIAFAAPEVSKVQASVIDEESEFAEHVNHPTVSMFQELFNSSHLTLRDILSGTRMHQYIAYSAALERTLHVSLVTNHNNPTKGPLVSRDIEQLRVLRFAFTDIVAADRAIRHQSQL